MSQEKPTVTSPITQPAQEEELGDNPLKIRVARVAKSLQSIAARRKMAPAAMMEPRR